MSEFKKKRKKERKCKEGRKRWRERERARLRGARELRGKTTMAAGFREREEEREGERDWPRREFGRDGKGGKKSAESCHELFGLWEEPPFGQRLPNPQKEKMK